MPPIPGRPPIKPVTGTPGRWKPGTLKLRNRAGGKPFEAEGEVLGDFGVRVERDDKEPDLWFLESLSARQTVCRLSSQGDARAVGEVLWDECRVAFRERTKEEVLALCPGWVRPWVLECLRTGRFVDPGPFKSRVAEEESE